MHASDLPPARRAVLRAGLALAAGAASSLVAACSGGSSAPGPAPTSSAPPDAATLLVNARKVLDAAPSLSFTLLGTGLPADGTVIVGGKGDLQRPDGFAGSLDVRIGGNLASVAVVSTGGSFWAKLPLTTSFVKADPHTLGFTDPGGFMDPGTGISQLLSQAKDAALGGETRIGTEVAREVTATLPGSLVDTLLTSADPAQDVKATFAVVPDGQLRRATLVGPFYAKGTDSTFVITLQDYGKSVRIVPPA